MDTRKIGLKNFGVHAIVELILGILLPYGLTGLTALIATRTGNIVKNFVSCFEYYKKY